MGLYELEEGVWGKTEISLLDYSKAFRMAYVRVLSLNELVLTRMNL